MWYERHRIRRCEGFVPVRADAETEEERGTNAYWTAMLKHATQSLGVLAGRAEQSMRCGALPTGLAGAAPGRKESARCDEFADKLRASRFLRATAQCVEVGIDVCVAISQAETRDRSERETIPEVLGRRVLDGMRPHLWTIAASLEPRLFWDPRPFWTGLAPDSCHGALWKLYARIFLLASFDKFQALRAIRRRELQSSAGGAGGTARSADATRPEAVGAAAAWAEEEGELRENLLFSRRSVRGPLDMGVGPDPQRHDLDDRDLEDWPMSILFAALDSLTEEWNRLRYGPETQRLVARCLLRYAMLGYATTPAAAVRQAQETDRRYAHDMPTYCSKDPLRGGVRANGDSYYGQGGAALRDMLSALATVANLDAWLRTLSPPTTPDPRRVRLAPSTMLKFAPLAQRLHSILLLPPAPSETSREGGGHNGGDDDDSDDEEMWEEKEEDEEEGGGKQDPAGGGEEEQPTTAATTTMVDSLMVYTEEVEEVVVADLAFIPEMRQVAMRCFASIRFFLKGREAMGAEKCFVKSGLVTLLLPGELWKFVRRWPDHGATPISILNGMRERDMILYRDHIITPGISSILEVKRKRGRAGYPPGDGDDDDGGEDGVKGGKSKDGVPAQRFLHADDDSATVAPWEHEEDEETVQTVMNYEGLRKALPGCLLTLVDHLVWETARHMMRMVAIKDGVEALPSFIFETSHVQLMHDLPGARTIGEELNQHLVWKEFAVWTTQIWRAEGLAPPQPPTGGGGGGEEEEEDDEECKPLRLEMWDKMMRHTATQCQRLKRFPPFPQILALRGRTFLWNPLARPYTPRDDGDGAGDASEAGGESQETIDREWVRECTHSVLVDTTGDSAPMALFLWLKARRECVQALLDRMEATSTIDSRASSIRTWGDFKLRIYDRLALQWFGARSMPLFQY